jgi:putative ABC transport system substrate-binding protein
LANLAARSGVPATYPVRDNALAGGLMSYGASLTDAYRQIGVSSQVARWGRRRAIAVIQQSCSDSLAIVNPTDEVFRLTGNNCDDSHLVGVLR